MIESLAWSRVFGILNEDMIEPTRLSYNWEVRMQYQCHQLTSLEDQNLLANKYICHFHCCQNSVAWNLKQVTVLLSYLLCFHHIQLIENWLISQNITTRYSLFINDPRFLDDNNKGNDLTEIEMTKQWIRRRSWSRYWYQYISRLQYYWLVCPSR